MNGKTTLRHAPVLAGALVAALAAWAPSLSAQTADGRWLPWMGCWTATGEGADGSMLCVRPDEASSGVEVVTLSADGEVQGSRVLIADGARHETREGDCTGWQEATFSETGRRVFLEAEQTCPNGNASPSTGLIAMTTPSEWVEVESIDVGDHDVAWVKRYRAASTEQSRSAGFGEAVAGRARAIEMARRSASALATVDDIIEAADRVDPEAVQAWIAETDDGAMAVDSKGLLAMADAGVPADVIDVVVAKSYPEHFQLARQAPAEQRGRRGYPIYVGFPGGFYSPFYSPYGYGYGYGYGGGYYGGYYYGYQPSVVVVQPRTPREHGQVVAGKGYSRGRTGSGSSSSSPRRPSAGRSSGGSSDAGSAGSTSGGTSTGRHAKPRGGGR